LIMESKLEVGVPSGKLSWPPKNCMPSRAKMKMKRKRRRSRDMMEDSAFIRAITRFRRGDQYLKNVKYFSNIFRKMLCLFETLRSSCKVPKSFFIFNRVAIS
jgi:hypothetical protein